MRRARNQKTKKSVAKRFKVTGTGKVMRSHAGRRHLLAHKGPGRRRRLRGEAELPPGDAARILECLPFSR
ncbi:MAG: 50S ribosomal protein L35 [Verrucomicrobiae bacterium]|nr:50S ribosomal protein L35 [Verrucomicrobiae bacterium]MCP5518757.1 50S ribosomal protein L35 [Verrucomicrobiales bacterium]